MLKKSLLNNSMNTKMKIGQIKATRCFDVEISHFNVQYKQKFQAYTLTRNTDMCVCGDVMGEGG